ncbi:putative acyl-CoA dehydrogenase ibr3, partial [Cymbomonas tetramitiformis]
VLSAANMIDHNGNKAARNAVAMAKVAAPRATLQVLDQAIQVHGAGGVCQDFLLAAFYAGARTLRIADGPDEVHLRDIARIELKKARL